MSTSDEYTKKREDAPLWMQNSEDTRKPDDRTWGDWVLKPGKPLSYRHRQFCIMFAMGATNKQICEKLDVTDSWISTIKLNEQIQKEVTKRQDAMFAEGVEKRLKNLGPAASDIIEKVLTDEEDPEIKMSERASMAKWLAEKLTGKASQEIKVEGNLIGNLFDRLDQITSQGKGLSPKGEVIDVSPGAESQPSLGTSKKDKWESWINENLNEKEKENAITHTERNKEESN